ncbi:MULTISPECIES: MarR family winged helix-turn-helix transcriptional regulator [unclassified Campylobacter]|uniref:MarR family winged helix-turn-helix transcriptional regulator n=1 Tax=unclassified Campylobacter TaxID=2593542 RepID=UPI0022E9F376|nr:MULTISPECIES: MarR family transcriptional regulator [unclassified Campylobacter]MDA3054872.1 MarR family transcriptional regulator [Campylobacter sp. VBCF_07 NA4]MDA3061095.1 MarR family transcriptional regulator [Campylobacter sp. VBCF_02 NA5]MDA3070821.1 MarR family transcriptional regulator [Campylobacter sp. VBCF_08 NA3]WBR54327.1 MarR family transcriptional regulator [Campylobacter sp. VBCF_01 NA2]
MSDKYDMLLLENQICFPTYAVANKILRRYQPLLKKINLTYTQYIVMMVLWEKKQINEKVLVKALFLQANTLSNLLKNLKSKGFVDIEKDPSDKRNIIISLTKEGEALREKALKVPQTLANEHWLSDEEFATFKKLLLKLLRGEWEGCK